MGMQLRRLWPISISAAANERQTIWPSGRERMLSVAVMYPERKSMQRHRRCVRSIYYSEVQQQYSVYRPGRRVIN